MSNTIQLQLPLPLPVGGRPGFAAKKWMEKIYHHSQSHLPGWGLPAIAGVTASMSLRAASQVLRQNTMEASSVIDLIQDLPVILTAEFAYDWEKKREWSKWEVDNHALQYMHTLADGPNPSSMYESIPNSPVRKIWEQFVRNNSIGTTCNFLETSAKIWHLWAENHPEVALYGKGLEKLKAMARNYCIDERHGNIWAHLQMWWIGMAAFTPEFAEQLSRRLFSNAYEWFNVCASTIGVHQHEVGKLFLADSLLVKSGLYSPLAVVANGLAIPGKTDSFMERMAGWECTVWNRVKSQLIYTGDLIWDEYYEKLVDEPEDYDAVVGQWAHLRGTFEETVQAVSNKPAARILIMGENGNGKSKLARDILQAAGRVAYHIKPLDESGIYPENPKLESSLSCVLLGLASENTKSGLIIDGHDNLLSRKAFANNMLGKANLPIIVVAEEGSEISSQLRKAFDRVIWLDQMPFNQRLKLASQYFKEETLALRVARALRNPKSISDAALWCQACGKWTWPTVQSHMRSHDKSKGYSSTSFDIDAPVAKEDLPPMAGNDHLNELADRLCLAFENPKAFSALGATAPKGAILLGPPGTGKTLFARHLAARLQISVISPDPSTLAQRPEKVAELFNYARQNAPCLVMLDEAEPLICLPMIGPPPDTLPALLTEIDGVEDLEGVIVIATTNNPRIAPALMRSGRLSEVREVQAPFQEGREAIWKAYLSKKPIEGDIDSMTKRLAKASRGLTGADIAETLRRAAIEAVSHGETTLTIKRLIQACDDVRWQPADGRDSDCPEERRATAIHEAGHALLAWRWGMDVQRITVRSRSGSLGMVQWDKIERRYDMSRSKLFGQLEMILGGLAAEEALLGEYGLGGGSDLRAAYRMISSAFINSGMGSFGPANAGDPEHWSDTRRRQLETDVSLWSKAAFEDAKEWLAKNCELVNHLADVLLENGDLSGEELDEFQEAVEKVKDPLPTPPVLVINPIEEIISHSRSPNEPMATNVISHTVHKDK